MHCRNCDYALWNITSRECPECGAAFRPSDYEFVPQSLRFCCPHCDHPYFGTGDKGHIEPQSFACLRCGRPVSMDDMVLRPGLGVEEQFTRPDTMPWLDRSVRGRVRAWFQMIGKGLTAPSQLITATPPDSPVLQAWVFALICTTIFVIPGYFFYAWIYAAQSVTGGVGLGWATVPVYAVAILAGVVVCSMFVVLLWTLLAHGVLRVTGRVEHGYRRTCQALLYSAGGNVFTAVPCFGTLVGSTWWAVSAILMLRRAQGVSGTRAAFAAGALPGLALAGWTGMYALAFILPMTGVFGAGAGFGGSPGSPGYQTSAINTALMTYRSEQGGDPQHAIELLLTRTPILPAGAGSTALFCDPSSKTTAADVPVGDDTLTGFENASRATQLSTVGKVMEAVPEGIVAHRLGDFVFTYHGAAGGWDPQLWSVVMLADPDVNGPPKDTDLVVIGNANMSVTETTAGELPALLKEQNAYRTTLGLPPLPDPATVTHRRPGVEE